MSEEQPSSQESLEYWKDREQQLLRAIDPKNSRIIGLEEQIRILEERLAAARVPKSRTVWVLYRSRWFPALVTALFILFGAPLLLDYLGVVTLDQTHEFYLRLKDLLLRP